MTCFIRSISVEEYRALQIRKNADRPFQAFDVDKAQRDRHLKTVSDIEPWTPPQNHPVRVLHSEIPSSEADRLDGTLDRKLSRQPWQRFLVVPKEMPMTISDRFENMPGGKLTLEPGQRFEAIVQITKVIADRDALRNAREKWQRESIAEDGTKVPGAAPWPIPDIIPIPSGKYSLYVGVVLYTNDTDSYYTASAKDITIQLGEPDSAGKKDTIIP